jgi:hypothetical protein
MYQNGVLLQNSKLLRHPEIGDRPQALLLHVRNSDEVYLDREGIVHFISIIRQGHFIVVICEFQDGQGYIRTAYVINSKRK